MPKSPIEFLIYYFTCTCLLLAVGWITHRIILIILDQFYHKIFYHEIFNPKGIELTENGELILTILITIIHLIVTLTITITIINYYVQ